MAEEYDSARNFLNSFDEYPTSPAYGYIPPTEKPLEGTYPFLSMIAAASPLGRAMSVYKKFKKSNKSNDQIDNFMMGIEKQVQETQNVYSGLPTSREILEKAITRTLHEKKMRDFKTDKFLRELDKIAKDVKSGKGKLPPTK